MKLVFMGTPIFALPALRKLQDAGHEIALLLCQPDRKKGRGQKITMPPTKKFALEHDIEIYQPNSLREEKVYEKLKCIEADFFIVIAYGNILPSSILALSKKGCINLHASLLPKWRGAAPIQFSLINGDLETGVTTMLMDEGLDTGPILLFEKTQIDPSENSEELASRLANLGGDLICKTIEKFDDILPKPQNTQEATYTRLLTKEDRIIDWSKPAEKIMRLFQGLSPKPGIYTTYKQKRLQIKNIQLYEQYNEETGVPGEIIKIVSNGFVVQCNQGKILVISCQPENKKQMSAVDFINGYRIKVGDFFNTD